VGESPTGEPILAGMAGAIRDGVDDFTGEPVRAGIKRDGRDGGAGGLPARTGGASLRGGGGGADVSSVVSSRGDVGRGTGGAGALGLGGLGATAGLGGTARVGSDGADDDGDLSFGIAGGLPKLVGLA